MAESCDDRIPLEQARTRMGAPEPMFRAFLSSGLLGFWGNGLVSAAAVDSLIRYGTQWRPREELRSLGPEPYQDLPVPPGIEGGEQPPDTLTEVQIAPSPLPLSLAEADIGWIAQFYLRPNRFFFVEPTATATVGPLPLKLDAARRVIGARLPTHLFPDPEGSLALITVVGVPHSTGKAWETAYDIAIPVLDELAAQYDQPLLVAHSLVVGVPSGIITVTFPKVPPLRAILSTDNLLPGYEFEELKHAIALYREGISSNNPFHRFLTLWKAHESVLRVRAAWRKQHRRPVVTVTPEKFPQAFAFKDVEGLSFEQARQKLNTPYRVALAHGDVESGSPRTAASAEDHVAVASQIPVIRHMARVALENMRTTLRSGSSARDA